MNLISKADIATHRQISKTVKDIKIDQFIEDAQIIELMPLLGEKFYFDILAKWINKRLSHLLAHRVSLLVSSASPGQQYTIGR